MRPSLGSMLANLSFLSSFRLSLSDFSFCQPFSIIVSRLSNTCFAQLTPFDQGFVDFETVPFQLDGFLHLVVPPPCLPFSLLISRNSTYRLGYIQQCVFKVWPHILQLVVRFTIILGRSFTCEGCLQSVCDRCIFQLPGADTGNEISLLLLRQLNDEVTYKLYIPWSRGVSYKRSLLNNWTTETTKVCILKAKSYYKAKHLLFIKCKSFLNDTLQILNKLKLCLNVTYHTPVTTLTQI